MPHKPRIYFEQKRARVQKERRERMANARAERAAHVAAVLPPVTIALYRAERAAFQERQAELIAEAKRQYQRLQELDEQRGRGGRPRKKVAS